MPVPYVVRRVTAAHGIPMSRAGADGWSMCKLGTRKGGGEHNDVQCATCAMAAQGEANKTVVCIASDHVRLSTLCSAAAIAVHAARNIGWDRRAQGEMLGDHGV